MLIPGDFRKGPNVGSTLWEEFYVVLDQGPPLPQNIPQ